MSLNTDIKQGSAQGTGQGPGVQSTPRSKRKRHLLLKLFIVVLLIAVVLEAIQVASLAYTSGFQLSVRIGNSQSTTIDLRQSIPVSPYLPGTNVFPRVGTSSLDQANDGFMSYSASIISGLRSAHIKLLRFPGGNWGELHAYSFDQLNAFSDLLAEVGANGMIQVPLTDATGQANSLAARASNAGLIVDYVNNKNSIQRTGVNANAPFHPVVLWSVGNEPDRLINPDTDKIYTVAQYVQAFVQFSIAMHQVDPHIQVFGPEISQFYGLGKGPTDTQGQLWMEGFLKGVSDYERQHPQLGFHLLDGVSFHLYPFGSSHPASAALLNSTGRWDNLLPPLRQLIRQDFGRDMPVAVTEVNTNVNSAVPSRGLAALWWADTLGKLMSLQADYVAFFSAEGVNTPYPLFTTKDMQETPMLRVMQLFAHLQRNYVPAQMQSTAVSMYVTQDDLQQTVSLLFVNKSGIAQQVQISSQGKILPGSPWSGLNVNLSPYSIDVVTLHRDGGAETYSYVTPTSGQATPALEHATYGG